MKMKLRLAGLFVGLIPWVVQPVMAQTTLPSLTGSWQLTWIAGLPPASTTTPVSPVPGLATFTSDGSVIETEGSELGPSIASTTASAKVVYSSPGHGIWQPGPAIGSLYIQFLSLMVNANGTLHATKTVTASGSLDSTGNHFTGTYSYQVVDTAGTVIASGSGALTGQKIPHPLLP